MFMKFVLIVDDKSCESFPDTWSRQAFVNSGYMMSRIQSGNKIFCFEVECNTDMVVSFRKLQKVVPADSFGSSDEK